MPDKMNASISVTKGLEYYGENIWARDQVFYVALYEEPECLNRVSEIMPLEFRMSSSATITFEGLEAGKTYYLGETDADGVNIVSGQLEDGTIFQTDFVQGQAVTASAQAGASTISFMNEFYELPNGFYREGELIITKKLVNADGSKLEANETFYAGIFADPEFTTLSDLVSSNIVLLELNGTSEVSESVQVAYPVNETIHLYVTEVDENGIPVSQNPDFAYEVTVDGSDVSLTQQNLSASVTITNMIKEEIDKEEVDEEDRDAESGTDKKSETDVNTTTDTTAQTGTAVTSVKTGDDTPMELYVILLAASAILLLLAEVKRRSRRNV
jgi:hypothetical protein